MSGHRDDGSYAEDRAHHPNRKVGRSDLSYSGSCSHCDEKGPVTPTTAYGRDADLCSTCTKLYNNR
jgi:hypothetical protein